MRSGGGIFIGDEVLELFPVGFSRELDSNLLVCFMDNSAKVCILFPSAEMKDDWMTDFFGYINNLDFDYLSSCENEYENLYTTDTIGCGYYRIWVTRFVLYFVDSKNFHGEIIYVDDMNKETHIEVSLYYESLDPVYMVEELLATKKANLDAISVRVTEEFTNECSRINMVQFANVDIVSRLNKRLGFNEKAYNKNIDNIFHFYSTLDRDYLQEKMTNSLDVQYKDPLLNCFRMLEVQKQLLQLSLCKLLSSHLKANEITRDRNISPSNSERQRTIRYEKRVLKKAKSSRVCQDCILF